VSSETSFVSKQPKLEPKLVSALSETRRLFWLFRFNIETESFGILKQPKQTKGQPKFFLGCAKQNEKQSKQIEFRFVSVRTEKKFMFRGHRNRERFRRFCWFGTKKFCLFRLFRYRCETPKQTEKFLWGIRETNRKTTETE
jgi:hypothetical protein